MSRNDATLAYVTRLGDNALILSQRMCERVAGEPELEEELANANFALDYIGQARMFYTYAGELEGAGARVRTILRTSAIARNSAELPVCWNSQTATLPIQRYSAVAVRDVLPEAARSAAATAVTSGWPRSRRGLARKRVRYHLRHCHASGWCGLGDGTDESHSRCASRARPIAWRLRWASCSLATMTSTGLFVRRSFGGPDLDGTCKTAWQRRDVSRTFCEEATLSYAVEIPFFDGRGRAGQGIHSEHLGYLVAEMQHPATQLIRGHRMVDTDSGQRS